MYLWYITIYMHASNVVPINALNDQIIFVFCRRFLLANIAVLCIKILCITYPLNKLDYISNCLHQTIRTFELFTVPIFYQCKFQYLMIRPFCNFTCKRIATSSIINACPAPTTCNLQLQKIANCNRNALARNIFQRIFYNLFLTIIFHKI